MAPSTAPSTDSLVAKEGTPLLPQFANDTVGDLPEEENQQQPPLVFELTRTGSHLDRPLLVPNLLCSLFENRSKAQLDVLGPLSEPLVHAFVQDITWIYRRVILGYMIAILLFASCGLLLLRRDESCNSAFCIWWLPGYILIGLCLLTAIKAYRARQFASCQPQFRSINQKYARSFASLGLQGSVQVDDSNDKAGCIYWIIAPINGDSTTGESSSPLYFI